MIRALGPYATMAALALAVALAAPALPQAPFHLYFGPLAPLLAMALVAGAGVLAMRQLISAGWAAPGLPAPPDLLRLFGLGLAFALPTVLLDIALPFPSGINAPLPDALAFYPAIGFVAETVFHLAPLAVISLLFPRAFVPAALAVALVEPVFQVVFGGGIDTRNLVMAVILIAFGLAQVFALRRHGFFGAIGLRLGYYLVWHILWGTARLPLLFPS